MTDHRPDPLTALSAAVRTLGLTIPEALLTQVLDMESAADPHGNPDERRAQLRRLLEQAAANE